MSKVDIYVDGSYVDSALEVNGGYIMLIDGRVISASRFNSTCPRCLNLRQVTGEIFSILYVMEMFAKQFTDTDHSCEEINIHYDYTGIREWATGEWRAKNPMTRCYQKRMYEAMRSLAEKAGITTKFHKVAAHTGNKWNTVVDNLANGIISSEIGDMYDGVISYKMTDSGVEFEQLQEES